MKLLRTIYNVIKHPPLGRGLVGILLLFSCSEKPVDAVVSDKLPDIYPDYKEVTIPVDIAPLNFNIVGDSVDAVYAEVKGSRGGEITAEGGYADFDIDEWHKLTEQNKGGSLKVTVSVKRNGRWTEYKPFDIYVSNYKLDAWGLTYRLIDPGYEVGGDIGIYQRCLSDYNEYPILTEKAVPGRCMNCHTPNRTNPKEFTSQIRGDNGGTLIYKDGKATWLNTKTEQTKAAGSYASWHPDGRYVAYATNAVWQSFFTGAKSNLEVYHTFSHIALLDTKTNQLILSPLLNDTISQAIFPAFSADGKTLYFSSSEQQNVPRDYLKVKCSICAIPFDAATGTFGSKVDTLLNGPRDNRSYVIVRPSYDGRWLMYTVASRSNFPIAQRDADLWMMDLKSGRTSPLTVCNTKETESYHNWSADSHWFVFSSKRGDGLHTRLYLSSIDDKGNATKPFLLPQRNPWKYYHSLFKAYNVPDFTLTKVELDMHQVARDILEGKRTQVTVKE